MSVNEGSMDRATRMVVGMGMIALGMSGTVAGTAGTLMGLLGVIPLATGIVGWCPLYTVMHWHTTRQGH